MAMHFVDMQWRLDCGNLSATYHRQLKVRLDKFVAYYDSQLCVYTISNAPRVTSR